MKTKNRIKTYLLTLAMLSTTLASYALNADYTDQDLTGADFWSQDCTNDKFIRTNLTSANFLGVEVTNADFTDAIITGACFCADTFTKEQLYSTASYKNKDLSRVDLSYHDSILHLPPLTGCNFVGFNLTNAMFAQTTLTNADFTQATLIGADFCNATLTNADFTDAIITGANFWECSGFTKEQLYSTASYKNKDLSGVVLGFNDLTGWNFAGQNLTNAYFEDSTLTNANLSQADLTRASFENATLTNADFRGATLTGTNFSDATIKNTIWNDGVIKNFSMTWTADSFSIRKYEVEDTGLLMASNGISAKIAENAKISNATLTLEAGARLEVVNNATLTLGSGGVIDFEITNADSDTNMNIASDSSFALDGGKILVNLVGDFTEDQFFSILTWDDGATVSGLDTLVKGENIFLTLNNKNIDNFKMQVVGKALSVAVPEPSTYAAILGALALGFVAYRRRVA